MARARYEEPPASVRLSDGTLAHVVRSAYAGGWELAVDGTPQSVLLHSEAGFVHAPGKVELDGESVLVVELAR